ncbi:MAG: sulfatase [Lentisphaerales bacterium]|nr:sulfatase [Lentisphaerales bacterium]
MKRNFSANALFLLGAFLLTHFFALSVFAEESKRPNFIIFYTDDQGYGDTSVPMIKERPDLARDLYKTPHLERLAKEGMRFSNAYSPAPTCTPSRISLQFGKTTARTKVMTVHDIMAKKNGIDLKNHKGMAEFVKEADANYVTAHFGKGMTIRRMDDIGYDITDNIDDNKEGNGNFHGDWLSIKNRQPIPADDPKRVFSLTKKSVEFINTQAKAKKPFFLMVSHYAVHVRHAALEVTIKKYLEKAGNRKDAMYAALIEHLDDSLGAMLKALDENGISDNTYVIFTSDNGGGHGGNPSLQGGKAKMMEGGLRVPTVVRGPGIPANSQCDVPIVQYDLLPTLHELSGNKNPLPKDIDGGSLADVFKKGNSGTVKRQNPFLVFHYPYYAGVPISAIRMGDYKFMRHLNTGETRLHKVATDMGEKNNLISTMPEKAKELDQLLQNYVKEVGGWDIEDVYAERLGELEKRLKESKPEGKEKIINSIQRTKENKAKKTWL